jgi:hypothetical protein
MFASTQVPCIAEAELSNGLASAAHVSGTMCVSASLMSHPLLCTKESSHMKVVLCNEIFVS